MQGPVDLQAVVADAYPAAYLQGFPIGHLTGYLGGDGRAGKELDRFVHLKKLFE
jgi:hypothetical protein